MQRNTYIKIDLDRLRNNIKEIVNNYKYKYYIGVVKNNCYHHGLKSIKGMEEAGINYFAVSSLEEAIRLRTYTNKSILCLEPISLDNILDIENQDITITIDNVNYLKKLQELDLFTDIKIHLALDTGMQRLGLTSNKDVLKCIDIINNNKHLVLEGIYTHFASSGVLNTSYDDAIKRFKELTLNVNLDEIKMIHMDRSLTMVEHEKIPFTNSVRLGIIMYGFNGSIKEDKSLKGIIRRIKRNYIQKKLNISKTILENNLNLNTCMSFYTEVMSVRKVLKNSYVGYNRFKIKEDGYILTLPVGYGDGVNKNYKYVSINNKLYEIVSDSMDMIMVYSDKLFDIGTKVEIFGDNISIRSVCNRLNTNSYHLFNMISDRVNIEYSGEEYGEI